MKNININIDLIHIMFPSSKGQKLLSESSLITNSNEINNKLLEYSNINSTMDNSMNSTMDNTELYKAYIYETLCNPTMEIKPFWKFSCFHKYACLECQEDNFLKNPFEVQEGVLECRCGSKRVFSYQKQTRGADEPMTTFAQCVKCGNKWIYNG
jgi:DNA-directed RNA polymerase subunit M/transcription elongation factor TFIIS